MLHTLTLLIRGRFLEGALVGGAGAVPARGFALRSRAALAPRPTGTTTGLRGARLTRDRPKRVTPVRPGLRKRGSGAEPRVDAFALASAAVERRKASAPR